MAGGEVGDVEHQHDRHDAEPEGRRGDARDRHHANEVVEPGILLQGGDRAERDGDQDGDHRRQDGDLERHRQADGDLVATGLPDHIEMPKLKVA